MAAQLMSGLHPGESHRLRLPSRRGAAGLLEEVRYGIGESLLRGEVLLEAADWRLGVSELRDLQELLQSRQLLLRGVASHRADTRVAASALGLDSLAISPASGWLPEPGDLPAAAPAVGLTIHRGTLRSGDHLQSEGSVLLLGDVNPGARISAAGHVLVWGRLRGIAHAGRNGDAQARITALQLRPLQLRIAEAVARGPDEAPAPGQAEQACLVEGEIRIDPASPTWPLSD